MIIPYRRFGTTYRSKLQVSRNPSFLDPSRFFTPEDGTDRLYRQCMLLNDLKFRFDNQNVGYVTSMSHACYTTHHLIHLRIDVSYQYWVGSQNSAVSIVIRIRT
jgi:hypothetical protein